jgi:hypothetical protein
MENTFVINPSATTESIVDTLYEKTAQAKAIVECILGAILSKELESNFLYEAVWAVDSYLGQIKELQEWLELSKPFGG